MINEELYNWYKRAGLDPWNFHCPLVSDCRRGRDDFTTARPPLIGERYADGSLPRLAVISSDPGKGDPLPTKHGFRRSGSNPRKHSPRKHWNQTLELVEAIQVTFDADVKLADAPACFVHERAVKCCENNPAGREANNRLFRNCRDYVGAELPVIAPDIVVTQGNRAAWAVARAGFHDAAPWSTCSHEAHDCRFRILSLPNDRLVLWLFTYHPTSRPQYYPKYRDGYFSCYPRLAGEFVEDRPAFRATHCM